MDNCTNGRVDILGPIGPQFNFADKICFFSYNLESGFAEF